MLLPNSFNAYKKRRRMASQSGAMKSEGELIRDFYRIKYYAMGYTVPSRKYRQPVGNHNAHVTAYYQLLWAQIEEYLKEDWNNK